ncbi:MAG: hypothetical protein AAGD32_05650 [Planctomycetota bacterium]
MPPVIEPQSRPTLRKLRERREALVRQQLAEHDPSGRHPYAFCSRCGRVLLAPQTTKLCDQCGADVPEPSRETIADSMLDEPPMFSWGWYQPEPPTGLERLGRMLWTAALVAAVLATIAYSLSRQIT